MLKKDFHLKIHFSLDMIFDKICIILSKHIFHEMKYVPSSKVINPIRAEIFLKRFSAFYIITLD